MDCIKGNYTGQPNYSFPMDCETLEYIQNNNYISQIIGNVCDASCVILSGCGVNGNGMGSGYVFVKTAEYPEGEVLPYDYSNSSEEPERVYLCKNDITISSLNVNYPNAYTKRWISSNRNDDSNITEESFDWRDFVFGKNCGSLIGEIKIWSGSIDNIPDGYLLCDGQDYNQTMYPHLYRVIGNEYNTQYYPTDYNSTENKMPAPNPAKFRVPDLRTRFVMGYYPQTSSSEYELHVQGGKNTVKLTGQETGIPFHSHTTESHRHSVGTYNIYGKFAADDSMLGKGDYQSDAYLKPQGAFRAANDTIRLDINSTKSNLGGYMELNANSANGFSGESAYQTVTVNSTEAADAIQAHENRPRYYVMAYIIRAR